MKRIILKLAVLVVAIPAQTLKAQHSHLETGAESAQEGSPLIFVNGDVFSVDHGFVQPLTLITEENMTEASAPYLGYYAGNISFTVRAATLDYAGPEPNHPALGTEIYVEMLSVEGPAGGTFAFWEHEATQPTFEITPDSTETVEWRLSENNGLPGSDPYGHIHGRQFTASSPGIYTVTFGLYDHSTNGTGGGPLHQPSETLQIRFLAGDGISITTHNEGDFIIGLELHDSILEANLREDDGHTDHVHDLLDPAKNVIVVSSDLRSHLTEHESYLGKMGSPVWKLLSLEFADDDHTDDTPLELAHEEHEDVSAPTLSFSTAMIEMGALLNDEVSVSLASVSGPGTVTLLMPEEKHSLHAEESFESPVLAGNIDDIDGTDTFHIAVGELFPVTWAFSAPGDYEVTLNMMGSLALDSSEVSASINLLFEVLPSDKLEHAFMDGILYLTWDEDQELHHSSSLDSEFEPVTDAHGSYTINPVEKMGLYQLEEILVH